MEIFDVISSYNINNEPKNKTEYKNKNKSTDSIPALKKSESFLIITEDRSQSTKLPIEFSTNLENLYELIDRKFPSFKHEKTALFISDQNYERPIRFSEDIYNLASNLESSQFFVLKNCEYKNLLKKREKKMYPDLCSWAQVKISGKWKKKFVQLTNNDLYIASSHIVNISLNK